MQRVFAISAAVAALVGCGGTKPAAVPKTCPPAPRGIARPAMLGWMPTPRGFVYTSARREKGDVVVSGYSDESLLQAQQSWFSTLSGSGRLENGKIAQGRSKVKIAYEGYQTFTTVTDVLVPVCERRTAATLTIHFDE